MRSITVVMMLCICGGLFLLFAGTSVSGLMASGGGGGGGGDGGYGDGDSCDEGYDDGSYSDFLLAGNIDPIGSDNTSGAIIMWPLPIRPGEFSFFVPPGGTGPDLLTSPFGMVLHDTRLIVIDQNANTDTFGEILQYDIQSGEFLGPLIAADDLYAPFAPRALAVRRGILYLANRFYSNVVPGSVQMFNVYTGEYIRELYLPAHVVLDNGLSEMRPSAILFGPDGLLYVSYLAFVDEDGIERAGVVLRFNADTRRFVDVFIGPDAPELGTAETMTFGPNGDLFLISLRRLSNTTDTTDQILRFSGPLSANPGQLLSRIIINTDPDRRIIPADVIFGPDGKLYVTIQFDIDLLSATEDSPPNMDGPYAGELRRYTVPEDPEEDITEYECLDNLCGSLTFSFFGRSNAATRAYQS